MSSDGVLAKQMTFSFILWYHPDIILNVKIRYLAGDSIF